MSCKILENATYGVEVEYYANCPWHGVKGNNYIQVSDDDSLCNGANGTELKFARGVTEGEFDKYISELKSILHPTFETYYADITYCSYTGHVDIETDDEDGTTGLHVHFGLNESYLACDIFRLILLTREHHNTICELAWREDTEWALDSADLVNAIKSRMRRGCSILEGGGKNRGLNICGNDDRNTIEFRYAHSALIEDEKAFGEYMDFIKSLIEQAFTGEPTVTIDEYTFNELSEESGIGCRRLEVIKEGADNKSIIVDV